MLVRSTLAAFILLSATIGYGALNAQKPAKAPKQAKAQDAAKKDFFVYDPADQTVPATQLEGANNYDGSILSGDDGLWLVWLEFVPGKGDQIGVGLRKGDAWVSRKTVVEQYGRYSKPTLTRDAGGRIWLTYEAEVNGQWDVFAAVVKPDASLGEVRAVSTGKGPDIHHTAAAAKDAGIWVVWQGEHESAFHIFASHVTESDRTEPTVVSQGIEVRSGRPPYVRDRWHPDVAVTPSGAVVVAWDAYYLNFNVYARALVDGKWTHIWAVAKSSGFEGRVSLAAGKDDRVWVAWEEGEENWGGPYRGGPFDGTVNCLFTDERGPLHRYRRMKVASLNPSQPYDVTAAAELPMPSMDKALARKDAPEGVKATGAFYERGRLAVDGKGRVWLVYRHYYTPRMAIDQTHHVESGWGVYARCLTAAGWSELTRFDVNQGDGMQRLGVAPQTDGVAVICTTGRTDRVKNNRPRGLAIASAAGKGDAPAVKSGPCKVIGFGTPVRPVDLPPPPPLKVAGKEYHVFYGDLHRHTDLSLCFVPTDGTMDDAYRYGISVAGLDFIGVTDHTHDLVMGDGLSQIWWRTTKEVTRHELKDRFVPIYSYERSRSDTDHNVFSLRPDILRPHTYPLPDFWKELDGDTFTIAHQPVKPKTWETQDNAHRPLFEIYQGCRDNVVAKDAHEGLGRGYLLGFICSSDHLSTSTSYAGVWAESCTRESIFRSLQARRTFGAMARMRVITRCGDHVMGERFEAAEFPEVGIEVTGTTALFEPGIIDKLEIVVDGQTVKTLAPGRQDVKTVYKPDALSPGVHYLYVHATQPDGNQAWSSPIWVNVLQGEQK